MKYLKKFEELNESSKQSRIERLISLGLAELDSFLRIKYSLNTGLAKRVWAFRFKEGQDLNADSLNEPGNELAEFWAVPPGFNDDIDNILKSSPMRLPWPDDTSYEGLRHMAQELSLAEFMDELDRILLQELHRRFGTPRYMNKQSLGPIVLVNTRTGEISQLEAQVQESADNASRLVALGLLDPEQTNRIEYNVSRHAISKLFDALRVPPAWQEVEPALGRTFFFVYGYDATGTVTTGLSGIPVGGEQFLTRAALDELREAGPFDEYEFMDKIIELFIDWIRTRPAEYLKDRFGFTSRPLFIRDETDALLGRLNWTPLKESRGEGLAKLLDLGLIDPSTEYRVEYKVSDWFLDYMSEDDTCRRPKAAWEELKNAIVTRVHIYEPRRDTPAGYMSLVGLDLFESPDDVRAICAQELDREGLRLYAEKLAIEVIKQDFDPASIRSRILSDRERPTLIRRIGDDQWQPFTINESKRDADLMRLISLGLAQKPVYISYEINGLAIDGLISGNAVPKEERNAKWRKRMEDIVLSRTIGWWELRKPVQGDEDPSLNRDHAIVDDYYLLNDGGILLGMLIKEDEFSNFSDDPQELHWLLSERLREGLRSRDPRLWGKYRPEWITEDGTDQWYSMETGERLS
jgi:hypothetical protein